MKKDFGFLGNQAEKNFPDIIKVHVDYIFSETNNVTVWFPVLDQVIICGP